MKSNRNKIIKVTAFVTVACSLLCACNQTKPDSGTTEPSSSATVTVTEPPATEPVTEQTTAEQTTAEQTTAETPTRPSTTKPTSTAAVTTEKAESTKPEQSKAPNEITTRHRNALANAAITADCTLQLAMPMLTTTLRETPTLIIGWGRIGKCLAALLKALDSKVTVAARKHGDRAMLQALGYISKDPAQLQNQLIGYRVIFNTAPAPVISETQIACCRKDCVLIDLASSPGLTGKQVIWARGLPGKDAPESSGTLIAKTLLRVIAKKEATV